MGSKFCLYSRHHTRPPNLDDRAKARLTSFEDKWLPRSQRRLVVIIIVGLLGLFSLAKVVTLGFALFGGNTHNDFFGFVTKVDAPLVSGNPAYGAYLAIGILETVTGAMIAVGLGMLLVGRDRTGVQLAASALILSLTVTNVLSFYFNQFSVVTNSVALLGALLVLARFRGRYLNMDNGLTAPT